MRTWIVAPLALLLAACIGPGSKENFYTLSAPPATATGATPRVLVGAVTVPEAVDRTAMVIRIGPNQVDIDDGNRWAEPLKAAIPRVLAENLRRELGSANVFTTRQSGSTDVRVGVEIQRFDSSFSEGATLDATWTVTPATGAASSGRTVAKEAPPTRDAAGIAAAHSKALETLARDVAAAIRKGKIRGMNPEQIEREYNNRLAVPEHPQFFERWERDSDYVRRTLEVRLDIPYGADPRHRIDLFPARNARGLLAFIHGGYWRTLDKKFFAWIAPPFVAAGVSVANVNYRLCPQVGIGEIVDDVVAAANALFEQGIAKENVVISGHSGGHLTAALFASGQLRFDTAKIVGGVPISGVFDLEPLPHYSANTDLKLDAASARRLSVMTSKPVVAAPLVVAAGGSETGEFQRQSRDFAAAWGAQVKECQILPGYNHFSILDAFVERGQPLHTATLNLFR